MKHEYWIEVTDCYGGEANYSWVTRVRVRANTHRGALRRAGIVGYHHDYSIPDEFDTRRYVSHSGATCVFVSFYSPEGHGDYRHTVIE